MRTVALVSQKGGVGKTTLAINLAGAAQRDGLQVVIADTDP
jgi:chromosome partitioning protein